MSADVADGYNVTKVTSAAEKIIGQAELPQGVTAAFQGENEAIMDAIRQLLLMLLLGIVLVYLVMVAQFQSLRSPLIVMFTIPWPSPAASWPCCWRGWRSASSP